MADRHFGVGCDQVLLLEPAKTADADFNYRIFNADGSEVGQCGNGARCAGQFLFRHHAVGKKQLRLQTLTRIVTVSLCEDSETRVDMGAPVLAAPHVMTELQVLGQSFSALLLNVGNPHAVIFVDDVEAVDVTRWGRALSVMTCFPEGSNIEFVQVLTTNQIKMRVYERGAGETLACGSGACAAVIAGVLQETLDNEVVVGQRGGDLLISWQGDGASVWMKGAAEFVFDGEITLT